MLCTPASGRVRGRLAAVRELGRALAGDRYREFDGAGMAGAEFTAFLRQAADLVIVVGGDGTLHAVLGALLDGGRATPLPALLAVPAGTTNMSALDLGIAGEPVAVLSRFRARLEQSAAAGMPATSRPVLRVTWPGARPLYGMFFGAGIIARGVEYFTRHVRATGLTGEAASGLVVARFLGALLRGGDGGLTAPVRARFEQVPGLDVAPQACVAILASVLDRLLLGMRPYWGAQNAPIHVTAVRSRPARLWRHLLPLLRGRGQGLRPADGYVSANVHRCGLCLDGPFVIDGQRYDAAGAALVLTTAGPVSFLRP